MFKKPLASVLSAAFLVAGAGHLTLITASQTISRGPVTGVPGIPTTVIGLNSPVSGASALTMTNLTPASLTSTALMAAPHLLPKAMPVTAKITANGASLAVTGALQSQNDTDIKNRALQNVIFDNSPITSHENIEGLAQVAVPAGSGRGHSKRASVKPLNHTKVYRDDIYYHVKVGAIGDHEIAAIEKKLRSMDYSVTANLNSGVITVVKRAFGNTFPVDLSRIKRIPEVKEISEVRQTATYRRMDAGSKAPPKSLPGPAHMKILRDDIDYLVKLGAIGDHEIAEIARKLKSLGYYVTANLNSGMMTIAKKTFGNTFEVDLALIGQIPEVREIGEWRQTYTVTGLYKSRQR